MDKKYFLKDNYANIILRDKASRPFIVNLISKTIGIDKEIVSQGLMLESDRINTNGNTKDSKVDTFYSNNTNYINIEVNLVNDPEFQKKNVRYICNLFVGQVEIGEEDKYKPIYQINLNNFDYFDKGKFIYRSTIREESLNKVRDNSFVIIDITLENLRNIDYNIIKEEEDDSLEKMLYFFICNDNDLLDGLYVGNNIMGNVNKKLKKLKRDYSEELYYNYDELLDKALKNIATQQVKKEANLETSLAIAKNLLAEGLDIDLIARTTGLTQEKIEELK